MQWLLRRAIMLVPLQCNYELHFIIILNYLSGYLAALLSALAVSLGRGVWGDACSFPECVRVSIPRFILMAVHMSSFR